MGTFHKRPRTAWILIILVLAIDVHAKVQSIAQPPVACAEEIIPAFPPNGTRVTRLRHQSELVRAMKFLEQEDNAFTDEYEDAWNLVQGARDSHEKAEKIYEAADQYQMPPQILAGALFQESKLVDTAISEDYGNWSCGVGQINLNEWCSWAEEASPQVQAKIQWPSKLIHLFKANNPGKDVCDSSFIAPIHAKPFRDIGMARLNAERANSPEYMMQARHIRLPLRITYSDVQREFDQISKNLRQATHKDADLLLPTHDERAAARLRFALARSFAENCEDHNFGIPAKAFTLREIFEALPEAAQVAQHYQPNQKYQRKCWREPRSNAYPLQIGWLLADILYNAGDDLLPGILRFRKARGISWNSFGPASLVQAVDWALAHQDIGDFGNARKEATFHIRKVIHHVTLPGEYIVDH